MSTCHHEEGVVKVGVSYHQEEARGGYIPITWKEGKGNGRENDGLTKENCCMNIRDPPPLLCVLPLLFFLHVPPLSLFCPGEKPGVLGVGLFFYSALISNPPCEHLSTVVCPPLSRSRPLVSGVGRLDIDSSETVMLIPIDQPL